MAQSRSSDHVGINDQGRDATWRIVGRLIAREIRVVDLHLSEGGT